MAITLYDLSVGCFLQTLGAVEGFLAKGLAHCQEKNIDPNEIVEARLFADMLPFRFQVWPWRTIRPVRSRARRPGILAARPVHRGLCRPAEAGDRRSRSAGGAHARARSTRWKART